MLWQRDGGITVMSPTRLVLGIILMLPLIQPTTADAAGKQRTPEPTSSGASTSRRGSSGSAQEIFCGVELTQSVTLQSTLDCRGKGTPGLVTNRQSKITIDLNGKTIMSDQSFGNPGVLVFDSTRVTVKN